MRPASLAALALALTAAASAQPAVGLRASGGASGSDSSNPTLSSVLGLGLGAFAELPLTELLTVVADVGYAQGGVAGRLTQEAQGGPEAPPETVDFRYRTHFVSFAPTMSVALRSDGGVEPSVFLGPRADVKLGERLRFEGESSDTDDFPDAVFGVTAGAGVAGGRLRLDVRGSYLLSPDVGSLRQVAFDARVGVTL